MEDPSAKETGRIGGMMTKRRREKAKDRSNHKSFFCTGRYRKGAARESQALASSALPEGVRWMPSVVRDSVP